MLDHSTLTGEDLDILTFGSDLPNLGPNFHSPEALLSAVDYFQEYNMRMSTTSRPLTSFAAYHLPSDPEQRALECQLDQVLDEQNSVYDDGQLEVPHDVGFTWSYPDEDDESQTDPTDDPDPFFIDEEVADLAELPDHVMVIHATVSWLHLQFHLPCIACNALLAIFSLLLLFFNLNSSLPFTTLHSGNRILGVDKPVHTLPVCPTCRDVYPPATSLLCHDTCTSCNVDLFLPGQTLWGNARALKTPIIKYPYLPLSEQISSILMIPGVEDVLDGWRGKSCLPGIYTDIFDGSICRTKLKGPDGKLFFSNDWNERHGPNNELCLGVNLGVDCIMPGPKEQTPDQVQRFLRPIVSDLLQLWKYGIKIPTESQPEGRLIHVTLVAVVCDKPAAHKIGGFASHSHNYYCTCCWIRSMDKGNVNAFQKGAHPPWTNVEQCRLGEEYRNLPSPNVQKIFVKDFATCYSQLSRLPYFDLVEQVVVDPMHNLFLGLMKTHFYHIWVQGKILRPNHELGMLHSMLADFIIPGSCGKLPTDIGTPTSGSLTADQWLLLATVYGPIIIPQIWSTFLPSNASDEASSHRIAVIERAETEKQQEATRKANNKASSQDVQDLPEGQLRGPPPPPGDHIEQLPNDLQMPEDERLRLHPKEPANFLKLSMAICILIKRTITNHDIDTTDDLLREYGRELIKLYGSAVMKPNHHYATHVGDCACNFGPLHDFWMFLFERLNKILKSFKANNHANGELESTFFKEFHRTCETSRVIYTMRTNPAKSLQSEAARIMQKVTHEERGTIAGLVALSQELDEISMDGTVIVPLNHKGLFYDYVIIEGKRIHASKAIGTRSSSLVHVMIPGQLPIHIYGEILEIFQVNQHLLDGKHSLWLAQMRWFKPYEGNRVTIWDEL
ncbi:hypothetical protein M404DRAFT_171305 [Pisolithus tinctorius Marx 270]|uniref:Uncharacterized protein n=1 Tax=Pisolithus tinctorius Marx 270 TaxID=870435 RepID=A0A0C3NCV6_PISTI|nr:hypothetical protein M404DRAFT_171305 [Pisolithus tinctorius Marx 270]